MLAKGTELLEIIRSDSTIRDYFLNAADFDPYDTFRKPNDLNGEFTFTQAGSAFGMCGDGTEYILIDDGSVAMFSHDGNCGRIAESLEDFIALLLNFPCFGDFLYKSAFREENKQSVMQNFCVEYYDVVEGWESSRDYAFNHLSIDHDNDIWSNTMKKLYFSATREPRFGYYYNGVLNDELLSDNDPWWI